MAPQTLLLATVAAIVGLTIGVRRGGTLSNLANADLQWWRLFFFGLGLIGLAEVTPDFALGLVFFELTAVGLTIVGLGLLIALAVRNAHLVGVPVVAFGLALNLLGIMVNHGVAVDKGALLAAHVETPRSVAEATFPGAHHLRTGDDSLWWLGDAIPVRELETVLSFGDLVVIGGLATTLANLTRRKKAHAPPELSPHARAGLVSIAAPDIRLDDEPVLDLALLAEAADHGYAARPNPPSTTDGDDERESGPGLRDGTEPSTSVGIPILGQS